ncbi:MAG: type IV secretion system protein [Acidobacteria bacterium]|nr:type IV secretion system protein [Acidobacteriota bacterium]
MQLRPPQSIDPNVPAIIPEEQQQNFKVFLDRVLDDVVGAALPGIIQAGDELWLAMATIAVTWAGLQVAFSGSFHPWEIVKLIIVLSIPKTMLHYYSQALPNTTSTFPEIVVEQGIWLQNLFVSDIVSGMHTELNTLFTQQGNAILAAWQGIDIEDLTPSTAYAVVTQAVPSVAFVFFGLLLLALFFITYAQVLWGHLAVSISILLGPIFIPWLVFEPMAFLFWGWFRTVLTYSLYAAIAGAILRIWGSVGLGYVTTFSHSPPLDNFAAAVYWSLILLPLCAAGILAACKTGEMASLLISGAAFTGSGGVSTAVHAVGKAARSLSRSVSRR